MNKNEYAQTLFQGDLNCAQTILSAFAPQLDIELSLLQKIGSNFGGGMGEGETCGVITGALMVLGLLYGTDEKSDPSIKEKVTELSSQFKQEFGNKHGSLACKDLIGYNTKTPEGYQSAIEHEVFRTKCPLFIEETIEILDRLVQPSKEAKSN